MSKTAPASEMANAVRFLAIDAVNKANSGHPGMPMGMAEIATVLFTKHLRFNPADPDWPDRDRFVLSNGHGSMLQYAMLHLTGYDISIDDLKSFRQMESITPGHPEYGLTPGVETTTGPLGQGIANAVGMALSEKLLAAQYNRPGLDVVDHYTYVFLGEGCLMEGISQEACSLAGTWKLNKLIVFFDQNGISIDGKVEGWFTDDTPKRFESMGWNAIADVDGHDMDAIDAAITAAKKSDKPTIICCRTVIGKGSPKLAGTRTVHGAPIGADEAEATRKALGWNYGPFEVPQSVYDAFNGAERGFTLQSAWQDKVDAYSKQYPDESVKFLEQVTGVFPYESFAEKYAAYIAACDEKKERIATRKASQNAIEAFSPLLPQMMGGSADLTWSNLTNWSGSVPVVEGKPGNYISYGVREFGMCAIMNGMLLHKGYVPFGGMFMTFSDYCKNAMRMASLMKLGAVYVLTHDSVGVGEDGATHQPIEQVSSLRLIPGFNVWRPCDTVETAVAWQAALMNRFTPTALVLSRQAVDCQTRTKEQIGAIAKGGYVLKENAKADVTLIATGSEVETAMKALPLLEKDGISARVVSMPSTNVFDSQDAAYKKAVLGNVPRVAVEAGTPDLWYKYTGTDGAVLGISSFGYSAPAQQVFERFNITPAGVVATVKDLLKK